MILATVTILIFINKCLCNNEEEEKRLREQEETKILIKQAEYYGMNYKTDNSPLNLECEPLIFDFIAKNSPISLPYVDEVFKKLFVPQYRKTFFTNEFKGWLYDNGIMDDCYEKKSILISNTLDKIFEFSKSNNCNADFGPCSSEKIFEIFRHFTFGDEENHRNEIGVDLFFEYHTRVCSFGSNEFNPSKQSKIESLLDKLKSTANIILNNFNNLTDDQIEYTENNTDEIFDIELPENPSTSQYQPYIKNNEVQNQPDILMKIQNELDYLCTSFMDDLRDVHNELLNEWNAIFALNESLEIKKVYIEAMNIKHSLLLNFKNIMMIFFNSIRILKNEPTLKSFEIEIKDSIDGDNNKENIQNASSSSSIKKEVLLKSIDTDLQTLLTNYCVSLFTFVLTSASCNNRGDDSQNY